MEMIDQALTLEDEIHARLLRLLQSAPPAESASLADLIVKQQARAAYAG